MINARSTISLYDHQVIPRRDSLLTRVGYMLRSESRIRPVWFDAVRKFPPIAFGAHTRVRDLPRFRLPEDHLAVEFTKRNHGASWVEKLVPTNRRFAETIRTVGHQTSAGTVSGQRYLSPAYEFARRQHYLMQHKQMSAAEARTVVDKSFASFAAFDRGRTDRLLQRAIAGGAKLSMSVEESGACVLFVFLGETRVEPISTETNLCCKSFVFSTHKNSGRVPGTIFYGVSKKMSQKSIYLVSSYLLTAARLCLLIPRLASRCPQSARSAP